MEDPQPQPIAFKITRLGKETEEVRTNTFQIEGNPPKYIFHMDGRVVLEIFVHALENEPKSIYPQTPEQKAEWREFVQRANAANQSNYLKRD